MNRIIRFEGALFVMTLLGYVLHTFINAKIRGRWHLEESLLESYLFLGAVTAVLIGVLGWLFDRSKKNIGFAFAGGSFVKIVLSFVYLLPVIYYHDIPDPKAYIIHFMAAYLWVLFSETLIVSLELQKLN